MKRSATGWALSCWTPSAGGWRCWRSIRRSDKPSARTHASGSFRIGSSTAWARLNECPSRFCMHLRKARRARLPRPAPVAVEPPRDRSTRQVDPFQWSLLPPAHFGTFAVLLHVKYTHDGARPAQPSSRRVRLTRRLASAGPSPTRTAPCAPCAARRAHHSPTEPEESQQRYKDPLPGGARPAGTRYGAPAPCLVAAPRTAGLRGRATLPQLDWGRPARVACEFCDLAPARLGPSVSR